MWWKAGKKRWGAALTYNGNKAYLGQGFVTFEEAQLAMNYSLTVLHGEAGLAASPGMLYPGIDASGATLTEGKRQTYHSAAKELRTRPHGVSEGDGQRASCCPSTILP